MTLLERYIFRRVLGFSFGSFAALVAVVWVVQVLQRIDLVRTTLSAAGDILWIALMLMPDLAAGVLPFAVVIGAVQALNAFNADSERAVVDAAGGSRLVIANPIMLLGLLAGLFVLFNSHVSGPAASSAFQNGIRAVNADAITLFLRPGRFEEIQNGLVVSVEDARGTELSGLFLSDSRDPTVDLQYLARQAHIFDDGGRSMLILEDGQLHRRVVATGEVSIIEFQAYAFDLSTLRPMSGGDWVRMSERPTGELLRPDASDPVYQVRPLNFVEELTARRTDWLYPIAFALWAVVVAGHARTNRRGSGPTMLIALGGALALKALGFVSLSLIERGSQFAIIAYLVPLASIATSALLYAFNVNMVETRFVEKLGEGMDRFAAALQRLMPGGRTAREAGRA